MRDYLYLWHDPKLQRLIASGLEFHDVVPELEHAGGVVMLRHNADEVTFDVKSGFDFVPIESLNRLAQADIYNFGDFAWADFGRASSLATLTDEAIAQLTFFAHAARPLHAVNVPGLQNRFLYSAHDDGWYARIYYTKWLVIEAILCRLLPRLVNEKQASHALAALSQDENAFWIRRDEVIPCARTEDIDSLQSQFWK